MALENAADDKLYDCDAAAALIGVRPNTIRSWWSNGRLKRVKIGRLTRVRRSDLLAAIEPEQDRVNRR